MIFCPQLKKKFAGNPSQTLMENLLGQGIPVASSCQGDGICGKCRVQVKELDELPPPSDLETKTLKKNQAAPDERLSCQLFPEKDITIFTGYW